MAEELRKLNLSINRHELAKESETISEEIDYWGRKAVDAEFEMDRTQRVYRVTKAEVGIKYRKVPLEGLKTTDSAVADMIESDPAVAKAWYDHLEAKKQFGYMDTAYQAVRDKSAKIRDLISLLGMSYFADSRQQKKRTKNDDDFNIVEED
jgi:hypothetical protein